MTRRDFLGAAAGAPLALTAQAARPNILMILMDDMAARSLSCYGNPHLQTPHLDRLASTGARFTQAYATPQCTPTRASLLTGQYTARHKMWHVIPWYGYPWARVAEPPYVESMPRDTFTVAKGLQQAGYATACIGKWHLTTGSDGDYNSLRQSGAAAYGFDVTVDRIGADAMRADRAARLLTGHAIRFIEENAGRPWFCYLSHHATHRALAAPPDLVQKYLDRGHPKSGVNNATFLASMEHVDNEIGRLLARLDELHLTSRTAVVFTTDNGGVSRVFNPRAERGPGEAARLSPEDPDFESTPLRGGKGTAYEGGIRVPLIVRWPGAVKAGRVVQDPAHVVDLLPTFLDMAGASLPEGYSADGISLAPLLRTGRTVAPRALYWYMPLYDLRWAATPCAVIRRGDFKLIEYFGDSFDLDAAHPDYRPGGRLELYNLRQDVAERRDLAARRPDVVGRLRRELHTWITTSGAIIPGANPQFDPGRAFEETRTRSK